MIGDLADHQHSARLPERTKVALEWADIILGGGHGATDELRARLRAAFTPAEIVEITYAIGTFIGYSKQIITLGMEPEALAVTVVPTPGSGG
jgi:alkylhydroperoxidase family enzyme